MDYLEDRKDDSHCFWISMSPKITGVSSMSNLKAMLRACLTREKQIILQISRLVDPDRTIALKLAKRLLKARDNKH